MTRQIAQPARYAVDVPPARIQLKISDLCRRVGSRFLDLQKWGCGFFSLLILFIVGANSATGQVVTFDPLFPVVDEPVTIYFHAAEGTGGLAGYTGDVYVHTGLITSSSTGPTDWRYVKTDWGENTADTKLERIGDDLYRLHIEDIRDYYNNSHNAGWQGRTIPASEKILKLAFVFRSADTSREGKDTGGSDIFVDLYDEGVRVRFVAPETGTFNPFIAQRDTTISVMAVAGPDSLIEVVLFFIDGEEITSVQSDTLTYDLTLTEPGRRDLKVVVTSKAGERDSAYTYVVRNPPITDVPLPVDVYDGINYDANDPTRVTLSLYAPGKEFVYVIGDFTDWEVRPEYFMYRDAVRADSVRWWLSVDDLTPGLEYAFQYLVDGEIRVADPYSEKVLDPYNDGSISSETYPDLKPYPTGKTADYVSVIETGREPFDWPIDQFDRPEQHQLVIYELLLRDFLDKHDFATLTDTLDYFKRLGVNALELMPISEFEGNLSWGYNPAFYFAPDKYYGSADDLKRLIDEAHRRGIAVILDVVYNHMTGASPFVRLYNEGDYGQPTPDNPWVNPTERHPFNVFYDNNHESTATQYWLDRANEYWLEQFNVDGFRFDLSKGFTQRLTTDVDAWSAYDASRIRLLKRMADRIWDVDPNAYIILEHFAENREEKELAEYRIDEGLPGMMFWGNLNYNYNEATMGYHDGNKSDFSWGYYGTRGWEVPNLITYMESHDEQRLMYKNLQYGNGKGSYRIQDEPVALDRMKLAGAFFFTIPGPKMIWQFGELGYDVDINYNGRLGLKPSGWPYLDDPLATKLFRTWQALLALRHEHPVFTSPETQVNLDVRGAVKTIKLSHPGMEVVIVGNFDVENRTVAPVFPATGTWYRFFERDSLLIDNPEIEISLLPGQFHLFTSEKVTFPEEGLITVGVEQNDGTETPRVVTLEQNYPNPFNPTTNFIFALPRGGDVRLEVFDVLGRRVALIADGWYDAGRHELQFDGGGLPSGAYVYRLQADGRTVTRKMLLAR